ncbi:MAG: response regulator transcription factor [Rhizobiaceae bacterium]|nr:response regulator transcription factor [Rhizobiaceae bacterium]
MPNSIFIADDHPFIIEGMERLISSGIDFEIVGHSSNGIDAISEIKLLRPDCAIIDLSMPGANGLEVFLECKKWSPETKFIVITGQPIMGVFSQLIDAGIHGLFLKNASPEKIADGIRSVLQGQKVVADDIQKMLDESQSEYKLTNREGEILQCIARGLSNSKIAEHLGVSANTVDSHRTNLMRKMNVHSTATLLVQAMKQGLIEV